MNDPIITIRFKDSQRLMLKNIVEWKLKSLEPSRIRGKAHCIELIKILEEAKK